ncbi:prolipoprotein diacylglyceryl transferase [Neolewinella aurantiaca]|uniref:Prolipoprotein diacylglyceryl transferase n=1 Tax=Neolewinella aurantiaca TaxID=2602767 RepID=A0A5C7FIC1_9BACT|nr:prolipoprotein diacylglyceryl transferase family protein [Neolewinella aurantiaca]TXF89579.1 prolipoprotein diacylglyceryl transferase [Neolewinella aurantiaca]
MYPDLSYLFHDLIGTDRDNWLSLFKTFGFFLLLAFIVAASLLKWELQRREKLGQFTPERVIVVPGSGVTIWDYIFNGLFGFVLGYKVPYAIANVEAWKQDAGSVLLSTDGWWITGLLTAAAFVAYYVYLARKPVEGEPYEKDVYPSERVGPITMMAAVGGLLGAKFFAIIEYMDRFLADPLGVLLSGDGLAIYGGLIGGALFVFLYLRKHGIKPVPVMDAVAPALIIAYGVGRTGCQLSGDGDWGKAAGAQPDWWFLPDWVWSFRFPHNVLGRGEAIPGCDVEYCTQLAEAVHPTSIYEMVMAFAIGAILWGLRKRLTSLPGLLFSIYLFFNGVERFFIEFARINDKYNVLGAELSQAQIIAICFMLAGLVSGWFFVRRARAQVQQ